MRLFPYASCVPFASNTPLTDAAQQRHGVLFRAAAHEAPPDELLARIEEPLGLVGGDTMRYQDRKKGQRRVMHMQAAPDGSARPQDVVLRAFLLAGDTSAEAWIKTLLQDELPAQAYGRLLLAPGSKPPVAVQSRGKQICSCFNVTDAAITLQLEQCAGDDATRLEQLQSTLKCGTNCGSCLPELKRMVRVVVPLKVTA
jgi:assimilatory nitrate reductase catalytic subunit